MLAPLLFASILSALAPHAPEWIDVSAAVHDSDFHEGEPSAVIGPGESVAVRRPSDGPWEVQVGLANHYANLRGEPILIYSARQIAFHDYFLATGHAGQTSELVLKLELSEPIAAFRWDIGNHGINVSDGAFLSASYSADGAAWSTAYDYPKGSHGDCDPPAQMVSLAAPASNLYLRWEAIVPEGQNGWWNLGDSGVLKLQAVGAPPLDETPPPASQPDARWTEQRYRERVIPGTFFGTTTHVNSEGMIALLKDLQVPAVRIDFAYVGLEPSKGAYNFAPDLWMIQSADLGIEQGLDQLVVLTTPPPWSQCENGIYPNDDSVQALEDFMFALASKYKGKIRYWQAGNEPNIGLWQDRFVTFLKAYCNGVKRADPENKVVLCGFAGNAPAHLDGVYRRGAKDFFDILDAHAYTRPAMPENGGFIEQLQALHEVMLRYDDDKPLWITEVGWNGVEPSMLPYLQAKYDGHRVYACSEEDQARGLARVYLLAATAPWVERVYFFHLHQEAEYLAVDENVDAYMGLFTPWFAGPRPKDAYFAVKTVVEVMRGATFKERVPSRDDLWALAFERNGSTTLALWTTGGDTSITLADTSMIESVTSMVGSPVLIKPALLVSGRPIYIRTTSERYSELKAQIEQAAQ